VKARAAAREDDRLAGPRAPAEGSAVPLHPQVKTFLDALAAAGGPKTSELTPEEARAAYLVLSSFEPPEEVARVEDRTILGPAGDLAVRVYTPEEAVGGRPGALLWFHGGGWVIGDLQSADTICRALANRSGAVVVSVDYRRAPEHRAPAALEDCLAALDWVAAEAGSLGASGRLAVGGDSAGGNLAALVCQRARDAGGPPIDLQLLVYPVTDLTLRHPSMDENGSGYLLTKDTMAWFVDHYLGDADPEDPAVSPLWATDLAGLPPAVVITAEYDPLRDEGEAYAEALRAAGVEVEAVRYDGQIHEFFRLSTVLGGAAAVDLAGKALRGVLA
jgi:acetyl esterase